MIDDDEEDFMIIRDIILKGVVHYKYTIDWRPSYETGLVSINEKKHDVYLIDYKLGAQTGLDLIKKAVEMGCEAPLIILTGQNNFEVDKQAVNIGAADYLVKGTISGQLLERSIRYAIANANHRKEMIELNTALEKRVKSRTIVLEETLNKLEKSQQELIEEKDKAEYAAKAKTQFLSNMSHEIRTPMNAVIGFTKVLLETPLSEKQKEYLNTIKASGDILVALINDILDLAKIEAGKMPFEHSPFNLTTSITEVLQLFETKINEKKLKLKTNFSSDIPKLVVGDAVRLKQIILNLVGNAVKFTSEGQITINMLLLDKDGGKVDIGFQVIDTGIGIPVQEHKNIFEKFQQAGGSNGKPHGGTGLGLAIVKQLVELQGGRIIVNSSENEGAAFTFNIKFKKAESKAIAKSKTKKITPPAELLNNKISILVVEDIRPNQLLIKTLLEKLNCVIDIADNGEIACEMLKHKKYTIILMDLQMPQMDGFEATERIRKYLMLDTPIIALTANVTTVDVKKCKAIGMNDYISKPIDENLLYKMIAKYSKIKRSSLVTNNVDQQYAFKSTTSPFYSNYLLEITSGNPQAITEIVTAYLEEIPQLTDAMLKSIDNLDWNGLQKATHSIIPSFALIGIDREYEYIARTIEEYAIEKKHPEKIRALFYIINDECKRTCEEIRKEFVKLTP